MCEEVLLIYDEVSGNRLFGVVCVDFCFGGRVWVFRSVFFF